MQAYAILFVIFIEFSLKTLHVCKNFCIFAAK
jgi:hypothetical protein